jgi:segregation and condensation protein A
VSNAPEPLDPSFQIALPAFEGPLDLLLHLIRKHELDVLDLPIAFVTERYLAYVSMMEKLNLDIASEYLVMAATLAHIKSKMLLPQEPEDQQDDETSEEEIDPRAELIRRLLEYQKYKAAAEQLAERGIAGRDVFVRGSKAPEASGPPALVSPGLFKLLDAFQAVLKRAQGDAAFEITAEGISIQDRMRQLTELLRERRQVVFEELFEGQVTIYDLVVTFMAVLEMAKRRLVRIYQADPHSPIHLRSTVLAEDEDPSVIEGDWRPDVATPPAHEGVVEEPEREALDEDEELEAFDEDELAELESPEHVDWSEIEAWSALAEDEEGEGGYPDVPVEDERSSWGAHEPVRRSSRDRATAPELLEDEAALFEETDSFDAPDLAAAQTEPEAQPAPVVEAEPATDVASSGSVDAGGQPGGDAVPTPRVRYVNALRFLVDAPPPAAAPHAAELEPFADSDAHAQPASDTADAFESAAEGPTEALLDVVAPGLATMDETAVPTELPREAEPPVEPARADQEEVEPAAPVPDGELDPATPLPEEDPSLPPDERPTNVASAFDPPPPVPDALIEAVPEAADGGEARSAQDLDLGDGSGMHTGPDDEEFPR